MTRQILVNAAIVAISVIAMEWIAWASHKYVMHGWGWAWHRSHHEPQRRGLERNDLYAIVFAAISIALIALGNRGVWPLTWVGVGMTVYGFLYFVVHDGLVHERWPFRHAPKSGYLKRLVQAHRLHHAIRSRDSGISFGFLYAPPLARLRNQFRSTRRRLL
jgi:beta-carotene 3-hydroxylase